MAPAEEAIPFTDIAAHGWVGRMPASMRPYLLLARLDRPVGIWLLFLPGARATVMRAAGCVVNDMWDRDLDRQVSRTAGRPLASGALRMRQALLLLVALLLAGLCVLLQLNRLAQALGAGSLVLVAVYPLAKRFTWWPQLVMGFTFGVGAPVGYAAAAGRVDAAWVAIYAASILWDLGFDTIYGFQDMEDDAVVGVKSTSRRFAHAPRPFVGTAYALTIICLALAGVLAGLSWPFLAALGVPAALLARQVVLLDIADPRLCLALFRQNRAAGLATALALLAGR